MRTHKDDEQDKNIFSTISQSEDSSHNNDNL